MLPERAVFLSPRKKRLLCAVKVSSKGWCACCSNPLTLNLLADWPPPPHEKRRRCVKNEPISD